MFVRGLEASAGVGGTCMADNGLLAQDLDHPRRYQGGGQFCKANVNVKRCQTTGDRDAHAAAAVQCTAARRAGASLRCDLSDLLFRPSSLCLCLLLLCELLCLSSLCLRSLWEDFSRCREGVLSAPFASAIDPPASSGPAAGTAAGAGGSCWSPGCSASPSGRSC